MDKTCEKVLDYFLSQENPASFSLFYAMRGFDHDISTTKMSYQEFRKTLLYLESRDYVTIHRDAKGNCQVVSLSYKGLHYKEIQRDEVKNFIFKSIAIPVMVSIITAAVTTGIGYIWGQTALSAGMTTTQESATPTTVPMQEDTQ
ncbi:MAG: hypothetical protein Q4Q08_05890 [Eubacteriales bacterium]|nr:hypothetical protein [Eubacteriales bacterium]